MTHTHTHTWGEGAGGSPPERYGSLWAAAGDTRRGWENGLKERCVYNYRRLP